MTKHTSTIKLQLIIKIPLNVAEPPNSKEWPEPERAVEIDDGETLRWDPPYGTAR